MFTPSSRHPLRTESWLHLLGERCTVMHVPKAKRRRVQLLEDSREQRLQNQRVDPPEDASLHHVVGSQLHSWLAEGSWVMCEACHSLLPAPLTADSLTFRGTCVSVCAACSGPYVVPRRDMFPLPLLDLSTSQMLALRPVVLHQGERWHPHRAGFRHHSRMSHLSWKQMDVLESIALLESPAERDRARGVFDFLMQDGRSEYAAYVQEHRRILASRPESWAWPHWRLLDPFLECALWPSLYWCRAWCDTRWHGTSKSVKRSFLVKVLSSVLDYGSTWSLVQFQHDRAVLALFTGRHAATQGLHMSMKQALRHVPETPQYLHLGLLALTDMHRLFGPADLMVTLAPGAFSTTWPEWLRHQRRVTGQGLLQDHLGEALHVAHCLDEIVRSFIVGSRSGSLTWQGLLWDPNRRESCVLAWAEREEYQSGARSRLQARQQYHGTGVAHRHVLLWLRAPWRSTVSSQLASRLPDDDPALRSALLEQQMSHAASLPVSDEAPHWRLENQDDMSRWVLELPYCEEDNDRHLRVGSASLALAYFAHQDFTWVRGAGDASRYMAKFAGYVTKANDAGYGWVDASSSGFQAALACLRQRPSLAQMAAVLRPGGTLRFSHYTKEVTLNPPDEAEYDPVYRRYLEREDDSLTYLQWLRSHRSDTEPATPYRRLPGGHVVLRVMFCSRLRDAFYGQWLTANVAVRGTSELVVRAGTLVPPRHRWFATCRVLKPDIWDADTAIIQELDAEGCSAAERTSLLAMYRAWRTFTDLFLLYGRPVPAIEPSSDMAFPDFDATQLAVIAILEDSMMSLLESRGDGSQKKPCDIIIQGGAGTGKSAVVCAAIHRTAARARADDNDLRVLLLTPTGILSDAYRRRPWPCHVSVDTFDGGLRYGIDDPGMVADLMLYHVLVVDECWFLGEARLKHVLRLRHAACEGFLLVLIGDKEQLQQQERVHLRLEHFSSFVLRHDHRSQDPRYSRLLQCLRHRPLTTREIQHCVSGHVLCDDLNGENLREHLLRYPDTIFMAVTVAGARRINEVIIDALFSEEDFLCMLPVDGDRRIPLYKRMRLMITKNVDKGNGIVNGIFATALSYRQHMLHVQLATGEEVALHYVSMNTERHTFRGFPVDSGYAMTIAKVQGREFAHIAILPDACVEQMAYVALSRTRSFAGLWWVREPRRAFFRTRH